MKRRGSPIGGSRRFLFPSMNLSGLMWCMTAPAGRTYRFTQHTEDRIAALAQAMGGISMQATVTLLVARGLDVVEHEREQQTRPAILRSNRGRQYES